MIFCLFKSLRPCYINAKVKCRNIVQYSKAPAYSKTTEHQWSMCSIPSLCYKHKSSPARRRTRVTTARGVTVSTVEHQWSNLLTVQQVRYSNCITRWKKISRGVFRFTSASAFLNPSRIFVLKRAGVFLRVSTVQAREDEKCLCRLVVFVRVLASLKVHCSILWYLSLLCWSPRDVSYEVHYVGAVI